jgi:hypothetical protein
MIMSKLVARISTVTMEAPFRPFSNWLMKSFPKPEISARPYLQLAQEQPSLPVLCGIMSGR